MEGKPKVFHLEIVGAHFPFWPVDACVLAAVPALLYAKGLLQIAAAFQIFKVKGPVFQAYSLQMELVGRGAKGGKGQRELAGMKQGVSGGSANRYVFEYKLVEKNIIGLFNANLCVEVLRKAVYGLARGPGLQGG